MIEKIKRAIGFNFYLLFFLVPFIFFPKTSELFEFNKMIAVYLLTVLVTSLWLARMILQKRIIFRKTFLDIPLILFLTAQLLSTFFSIDQRISLFGYYSRFHGGFLSSISYCLLFWAYVSNMDHLKTLNAIRLSLFSALVVSLWAIFEHFGKSISCEYVALFDSPKEIFNPAFLKQNFNTSCWVQDVKSRVFATLGQPNWLAAWIIAVAPITWAMALISKIKIQKILVWVIISDVFFAALLFTKSRSGILGFAVEGLLFWSITGFAWLRAKAKIFGFSYVFLIFNISFLILTLLLGTPWTPSLKQVLSPQSQIAIHQLPISPTAPMLETGGTESGKIRQIVWKGAFDIWKNHPILGTGVETFAFAYYQFRPEAHNLTSEWEFLYNKAHNEYLNFAATTGTLGLISYLVLIGSSLFVMFTNLKSQNLSVLRFALIAGFASILVTNFFGFSVVAVAILFFLYPAMAISLVTSDKLQVTSYKKFNASQNLLILILLLVTCYLLFVISKYWYSDYLFARGKALNDGGDYTKAREILIKSTKFSPDESFYWDELSQTTATLAVAAFENSDFENAERLASSALIESERAVNLSPASVNLKRNKAVLLIKLSGTNSNLLKEARDVYAETVKLAPTDAKLSYNYAVSLLRTGETMKALEQMEKTVKLKPDYQDARYGLALMYMDVNEPQKAKEQLEYILTYINSNDPQAIRELDEIR